MTGVWGATTDGSEGAVDGPPSGGSEGNGVSGVLGMGVGKRG
jgi:hypothetical protein